MTSLIAVLRVNQEIVSVIDIINRFAARQFLCHATVPVVITVQVAGSNRALSSTSCDHINMAQAAHINEIKNRLNIKILFSCYKEAIKQVQTLSFRASN